MVTTALNRRLVVSKMILVSNNVVVVMDGTIGQRDAELSWIPDISNTPSDGAVNPGFP